MGLKLENTVTVGDALKIISIAAGIVWAVATGSARLDRIEAKVEATSAMVDALRLDVAVLQTKLLLQKQAQTQ